MTPDQHIRYGAAMPRGAPKQTITLRVDPTLVAEFRAVAGPAGNFSAAVDEGIRWWIAREKRRQGKADPMAKHLAAPTDRERAARAGSHAVLLPPDAPQLGGKKLT